MINFHPTQSQLIAFAEGNAPAPLALMISAHTDMCPQCREFLAAIEMKLSEEVFEEPAVDINFGSMFADITGLPAKDTMTATSSEQSIELDGRKFTLPRALQRYVDKTGNWSHLLGNLWQAPVDLGSIGKANFIYMQKEGRVPEHTHKGSEMTLVIDGEFSDGIGHYDTGDFMLMDSSNTHAPYSEASEGCLVFTIVDAPLHFTSGVARLLNPFSHLFFK